MPPTIRLSLGASLLFVASIAILPPACAQGESGGGLVGSSSSSSNQSSSTGSGATAGAGGAGGSPSSSGAGGTTGAGGGSTASASATGTGGGPTSCDNNAGGCNGCQACVQTGACATQWMACQTSIGGQCPSYIDCMNGCAGNVPCVEQCGTVWVQGVTPYDAYAGCMCPICAHDCKGKDGC